MAHPQKKQPSHTLFFLFFLLVTRDVNREGGGGGGRSPITILSTLAEFGIYTALCGITASVI